MRKSPLYIDGADAYKQFGVFLTRGSYDNLVALPALKPLDSNNWPEEDGQEVDLCEVALATGEVGIELAFSNQWRFADLVTLLSDKGYHDFRFTELERSYKLRLASQGDLELYPGLNIVRFTFADDFPRPKDYVYREPVNAIPMPRGYEIDDKDLSDYGVMLLKGSNAEILKTPAVKKNLLRNFKRQEGAIYDGELVKFQTKDVALKCLMRAPDLATFWQNRDALLHDLTRLSQKKDATGYKYSDAERRLYCDEWSESYPCYYKSCKTDSFTSLSGVWWEFTLTLVFTSFRLEDTEYLLAAEAGELITTEDGMFYIDIKDYAD